MYDIIKKIQNKYAWLLLTFKTKGFLKIALIFRY